MFPQSYFGGALLTTYFMSSQVIAFLPMPFLYVGFFGPKE